MTSIFPKATWSLAHAPASLEFADDRNCLGAWTEQWMASWRDPRQDVLGSLGFQLTPSVEYQHSLMSCYVQKMCKLYVICMFIGYPHALSLSIDVFLAYSTVKSNRCEMPKFGPHPHCCRSETSNFGREIQGLVVKFTWRVNSFSSSRAHFCSNSRSELSKMAFSENCLFHGIPFHHIPSTFMNQILLSH